MISRDYHASDYCPLNQVNADNVKDLQLKWVWSMTEGGRTQAAPIVHNGVMYLNNAGNVMQALDAKTGEQIGKKVNLGTINFASPLYADGKIYHLENTRWFILTPDEHVVRSIAIFKFEQPRSTFWRDPLRVYHLPCSARPRTEALAEPPKRPRTGK